MKVTRMRTELGTQAATCSLGSRKAETGGFANLRHVLAKVQGHPGKHSKNFSH